MQVSIEAKTAMNVFKVLQKLDIIDKAEEFDRFYIWMREVEEYAETHCNS